MIKVLIIDDEEIIREALIHSVKWQELGCEVAGAAGDGESGFEMVERLNPDLVLVDICMPSIDGLELMSKIRQHGYECKVIVLSGHRQFEYAQQALRHGASRYLLKPVNADEISTAVKEVCELIEKERAIKAEYSSLEQRIAEIDEKGKRHHSSGGETKYSRLVTKTLEYINENYASKDMSLKTVSSEVFVSTWYLSKLIKRETGENFIKILTRVRLDNAKILLGNPQYRVYEVAAMVGFDDVPHFTKTFKAVTGVSPLEYRREYISKKSASKGN